MSRGFGSTQLWILAELSRRKDPPLAWHETNALTFGHASAARRAASRLADTGAVELRYFWRRQAVRLPATDESRMRASELLADIRHATRIIELRRQAEFALMGSAWIGPGLRAELESYARQPIQTAVDLLDRCWWLDRADTMLWYPDPEFDYHEGAQNVRYEVLAYILDARDRGHLRFRGDPV